MKRFTVLAAALLLWGCEAHEPATLYKSPTGYDGPTGQIVGTVGVYIEPGVENQFYLNHLYFRSLDGHTAGNISFAETELASQETHYTTDVEKGSVFALELPAGDYEFYDLKFLRNDGGGQWGFRSRNEFSLPFVVVAGQATYLGSFIAHGEGIDGDRPWTATFGGQFRVSDQFERDRQLIAELHPDIPSDSMQPQLLQRSAPPLVVRE